jgi:hypothetical protein
MTSVPGPTSKQSPIADVIETDKGQAFLLDIATASKKSGLARKSGLFDRRKVSTSARSGFSPILQVQRTTENEKKGSLAAAAAVASLVE